MTRRANYDLSQIEDDLKMKILACELPWFTRLCETWREIGFDQETVTKRIDALSMHLDKIWEGLVEEEDEIKSSIEDKVDQLAREIATLREELQIAPYEPDQDFTSYQLNHMLPIECKKLKEEKSQRLQEIQKLLKVDDELADRLGVDAISCKIDRNKVPSRDDLRDAEQHIVTLNTELRKRMTEYEDSRSRIIELLEDLGNTPKPNFETDLFSNDENSFDLSEDNLKALHHYCEELELTRRERKARITQLQTRFVQLWHRLALGEDEMRKILDENSTCKLTVVDNLNAQILRLEELRVANLECFTCKIRDEIRSWWDKCFFSDEQREQFPEIDDIDFTEGLLDAHEAEVGRLREFYDQRMKVFLVLENWTNLWEQNIEFEKRANDPNRFSKRGGGLLQEEKERKKFSNKLPKCEKLVEEEISSWEKEHDEEFLILGLKLKDYIKYVQEQHELEKQQEKEARLRRRQGETKADSTSAMKPKVKTPTKRRIGTGTSQTSSTQVKTPTKRLKGDEVNLPRSATFTKSPVTSTGDLAIPPTTSENGSLVAQTNSVPPPHPGSARGRTNRTTKRQITRILSAANSDDVLNGNVAVSYEDFKDGVAPSHRSSSMSDLRHLVVSGVDNCSSENVESPVALGAKSFHESNF